MTGEPRNRAERRRHARAHTKTQVIVAGDGIIAAELPGNQFEARPSADLAAKAAGEHRLVASAVYAMDPALTPDAVMDAGQLKYLNQQNLMMLAIWCWDCETPLPRLAPVCPAAENPTR